MGFEITPDMRRIISIAKHSLLPSIYVYPYIKRLSSRYPVTIKPSSTGEHLAEGNVKMGFSYEGATSAWICSHTTSLRRFHHGKQRLELERMALQLKHHSLHSLRDKMLQYPRAAGAVDMDLIMHVMWLHTVGPLKRRIVKLKDPLADATFARTLDRVHGPRLGRGKSSCSSSDAGSRRS